MSDLGLQLREVWKQPHRLPAEVRLGSSENTGKPRHYLFVACFAPLAYVPLVWNSEPRILIEHLITSTTLRPPGFDIIKAETMR
jgi:hypothetical protein